MEENNKQQPLENPLLLLKAEELESQFENRIKELKLRHNAFLSEACKIAGQLTEAEFWLAAIRNSVPASENVINGDEQAEETVQ